VYKARFQTCIISRCGMAVITTVMRRLSFLLSMQPICMHKISVQSSKPSHAYPIIRLPREYRKKLAGKIATIYKTTHDGSLAFLVIPKLADGTMHPKHRRGPRKTISRLHTAEVAIHPLMILTSFFRRWRRVDFFEICFSFSRGGRSK